MDRWLVTLLPVVACTGTSTVDDEDATPLKPLRTQMISAPLEQEVGVNAAGQCDGRDRRAGPQALPNKLSLE